MCEALEKKLLNISLSNLNPPIELYIVDIDSNEISKNIHRKYTNDVPVIVLTSNKLLKNIEFPRIPPRLKEDLLFSWIQKYLNTFFNLS